MKKLVRKTMLVLSFLGLFTGMFTLVSCKKEKQFSCDPEIHSWAKENVGRFQDITREQLATLPIPLAQAAYRTLTPEKKFEFWNEKLDIVYSQWDEPVREMIDDMRTRLSVAWFEPDSGEIDKEFIDSWEKDMLTDWMDSTNYHLCFCMIYTEKELFGLRHSFDKSNCSWADLPSELMEKHLPHRENPGGGSDACYCEWHSTCEGEELCINPNCRDTREGCRLFWLSPCTKICDRETFDDIIIEW